jgi:hypothetical protein
MDEARVKVKVYLSTAGAVDMRTLVQMPSQQVGSQADYICPK